MTDTVPMNYFAPPNADVDDIAPPTDDELVLAARGSRLAAALIDALAPGIFGGICGFSAAMVSAQHRGHQLPASLPIAALAGCAIGGLALLAYFVYSAMLVYRGGQTYGKKVMGIRVARTDGERVSFARFIFLRNLPVMILGAIPFVGYIVGLADTLLIFRDSRRCLHDQIADTCVVTAASSTRATLAGSQGEDLPTISF